MTWHVAPVTAANRTAACRALAAGTPNPDTAAARLLAMIARGELDSAGLFVATTNGGQVRGAAAVARMPGNQATLMPPGGPDLTAADASAVAALGWARSVGVRVVQAVLRPGDDRGAAAVVRAGLVPLTRLVFLTRDPGPPPPRVPLDVSPFASEIEPVFAQVLMASYDGSLDCPELNDSRPADDVIAGYRDSGGASEWYLARLAGRPAAVLLLTPGRDSWGLTYLGVAPFARRHRLGDALTRFAVCRATGPLSLSVDERNEPALRLYAKYNFRRTTERDVFVVVWPQSNQTR